MVKKIYSVWLLFFNRNVLWHIFRQSILEKWPCLFRIRQKKNHFGVEEFNVSLLKLQKTFHIYVQREAFSPGLKTYSNIIQLLRTFLLYPHYTNLQTIHEWIKPSSYYVFLSKHLGLPLNDYISKVIFQMLSVWISLWFIKSAFLELWTGCSALTDPQAPPQHISFLQLYWPTSRELPLIRLCNIWLLVYALNM